jgi:hypothetical protein
MDAGGDGGVDSGDADAGDAGADAHAGDAGFTGGSGNIPTECLGFDFEDLVYSPGGNALPNTCEPFHPTTNNPYAVRCVDAWPWYASDFPGDDACILPPPPDKGLQYGVHPQGQDWFAQVSTGDMSGYDAAEIASDFLVLSDDEEERTYYTSTSNPSAVNYYRHYMRARPGSHFALATAETTPGEVELETWGGGSPSGLFSGVVLPRALRWDENNPHSLDKPVEDTGYYRVLPAETGVTFDLHYLNLSDGDVLKEAWTNIWFEDDATIRVGQVAGLDVVQTVTMAIAPGETVDFHYSMSTAERVRILSLVGFRHAWTTNLSAWIERPGTGIEILYQSFHWDDVPHYRYDTLTINPVPVHAQLHDGAASGEQWLEPGEELHFNCRIQYTDGRAAAVAAPLTPAQNGTLGFTVGRMFEGEACILFGTSAEGPALNTPVAEFGMLPAFATAQ